MTTCTALGSMLLETFIGVIPCFPHAGTHHYLVDRTDKRGQLRPADQEYYWYCKEQNAFLESSFHLTIAVIKNTAWLGIRFMVQTVSLCCL